MLHLGDESVVGAIEGFVAIGERNLYERVSRGDEVSLHANATVGIVEAVGPDDLDGVGGGGR